MEGARGVADVTGPRRTFHVATEALSAVFLGPFLIYAGTRPVPLRTWERRALVAGGVACIVVDGWLLYRYAHERRN